MNAPHHDFPTTPALAANADRAMGWAGFATRRPLAGPFACYGCDALREDEVAFCPDCGEDTSSYSVGDELLRGAGL